VSDLPDAWVDMPSGEDVQALLGRGSTYDFGFVPAMMRLVLSHMDIAPHFGALFTQIMFAPGALERGEREMVAAVTAAAQDCFY
jgi:alkylhydroperoxidase family enzyme